VCVWDGQRVKECESQFSSAEIRIESFIRECGSPRAGLKQTYYTYIKIIIITIIIIIIIIMINDY